MKTYIQQGATTEYTNHEGYRDITANAAVANVMSEKKHFKNGDIVWFTNRRGKDALVVLVAVFDDSAIALELKSDVVSLRDYKVLVDDVMHADLGKLINVFFDRLHDVIKTMPDEAFNNMLQAIGRVLGCSPEPQIIEREVVKEVPKEVIREVPVPAEKAETEVSRATEDKLIRVTAQRDLYKAMYDDLFNRVLEMTGLKPEEELSSAS